MDAEIERRQKTDELCKYVILVWLCFKVTRLLFNCQNAQDFCKFCVFISIYFVLIL